MGTVILGKLESGSISKAQQLVMMPNRVRFPPLCPSSKATKQLLLEENARASVLSPIYFCPDVKAQPVTGRVYITKATWAGLTRQ